MTMNPPKSQKAKAKENAANQPGWSRTNKDLMRLTIANNVDDMHHTATFPIFVFKELLQQHMGALNANIVAQCLFCVLYLEVHGEFHHPQQTQASRMLETSFNQYWQGRMLRIHSFTESQRKATKQENWPALRSAIIQFAEAHFCYDHASFRLHAFSLILPKGHSLRSKTYGIIVLGNVMSRIFKSKSSNQPLSTVDLNTIKSGHLDVLAETELDAEHKQLREVYQLCDALHAEAVAHLSAITIRNKFISKDNRWLGRSAGRSAFSAPAGPSTAGSSQRG